ncbi:MAG TPA: hypothetical protein VK968_02170, partial [Roseimicrobium sp.]|nr:hypothetical protein [Roseimicrobium sp.]
MSRAFLLTALLSSALSLDAATYYVATNGNDVWTGTLPAPNAAKTDGPFASLEKARDAVRVERKTAAASPKASTVEVREGVYALSKTLAFEPADSGTSNAPVTFKAFGKEHPTLIGGKPLTGFTQHQGQILKTDTASQGLKGVYFRQLLFDGRRQHLARYPNFDASNPYGGGWAYADGKPVPMYQDIPGESKREFQYKTTDARKWANPKEGQIFVFARYNWWNNIVNIASVDPATRKITLTGDASYPIRPTDRYFVQNLLEELDAPGEWYLDKQTGTLYFWPPAPLNGRPVYAPTLRTIVEFRPGTS